MELTLLEQDADYTHARLEGRLDAAGAEAIGLRFTAAVAAQHQHALVDLRGVEFVASMGLRLLVSVARSLHAKGLALVLYGLRPEVQEVFEDAGLTQLLTVASDRREAETLLPG